MEERKRVRSRLGELRKSIEKPKLVCDCEDLLPFAWRTPMVVEEKKRTKVLRDLAAEEKLRMQPPAPPKR